MAQVLPHNSAVRWPIRMIHLLVLAALLLSGVAKGFVLCQSGEICHACAGSGQADRCGDDAKDCLDCCKVVVAHLDAALHRIASPSALEIEDAPAALISSPLALPAMAARELAPPPIPPPNSQRSFSPLLAGHGMRAPPISA